MTLKGGKPRKTRLLTRTPPPITPASTPRCRAHPREPATAWVASGTPTRDGGVVPRGGWDLCTSCFRDVIAIGVRHPQSTLRR